MAAVLLSDCGEPKLENAGSWYSLVEDRKACAVEVVQSSAALVCGHDPLHRAQRMAAGRSRTRVPTCRQCLCFKPAGFDTSSNRGCHTIRELMPPPSLRNRGIRLCETTWSSLCEGRRVERRANGVWSMAYGTDGSWRREFRKAGPPCATKCWIADWHDLNRFQGFRTSGAYPPTWHKPWWRISQKKGRVHQWTMPYLWQSSLR